MTAQIPDKILHEGRSFFLETPPALPNASIALPSNNQEASPTNCWRGYVGTWQLKEGMLYLTNLEGSYSLAKNETTFACWFSGDLRMQTEQQLENRYMGLTAAPDFEFIAHVLHGKVTAMSLRKS
jgi:hypothetical protein